LRFGYASATQVRDYPRQIDYRKGGLQKWLASVHNIKLAEVTPARIQEWKRSFVAKAGTDAIALREARISVNSIMRQARSLFSPKMLRHVNFSLPNPLPFAGIEFEPRQSMKYRSEIDIEALITPQTRNYAPRRRKAARLFCWRLLWVSDEKRLICWSGPLSGGRKMRSESNRHGSFIRRARILSRIFPSMLR